MLAKALGDMRISRMIPGLPGGLTIQPESKPGRRASRANTFPADLQKRNRSAGHRKSQQMLDEGCPDLRATFPGGNGTPSKNTCLEAAGAHRNSNVLKATELPGVTGRGLRVEER